jgi:hypothetical protein
MVAQDIHSLIKEYGVQGAGLSIPGVFGIGSQTYTENIPLKSQTPTGKPTIKWRTTPKLGEDIVNAVTGTKVEPVAVKAVYDQVQELKTQGKTDEAKKIVDSLSEEDWSLYKKFRDKDKQVAKDELVSKLTPFYKEIQKMKEEGRTEEAKQRIDALTEAEWEAYKYIKDRDIKRID